MGYIPCDWELAEEKREAELNKNIVKLARRAKGVLHRFKWVQGTAWAKDVKVGKEVVETRYDEKTQEYIDIYGRSIQPVGAIIGLERKDNLQKVGAVCSIGAVSYAAAELGLDTGGEEYDRVVELLDEADAGDIVDYNDTPGRTKAEIKKVFDKAVGLAEKRYLTKA